MAKMTHEYSSFPEKIFEENKFKDVDDSIADIINHIKSLESQGLYNQARRIVEQNRDALQNRVISAENMNAIDEEIRNLEIYALQAQQSIFAQPEEPDTDILGTVWIGD